MLHQLLLVLHKPVVVVVELRETFEQGHKLIVGAVALQLLAVLQPEGVHLVEAFRQLPHVPHLVQRFGKGILEDEGAIAIVYQLDKPSIHHLAVQRVPAEQRHLVGIQLRHRLLCRLAANGLARRLDNDIEESVHTLQSGLAQYFVFYCYLYHTPAKVVFFFQ